MAGPERKSRILSKQETKVVAYHESGHALVAKLTPGTDPVHKISIISRGQALGYTLQLPTEDKYLTSKTELINRVKVLLGGRVAEQIVFGEITTGATDDLTKATDLVTRMVMEFGMSESLGPVAYKKADGEVFLGRDISQGRHYSDRTAETIDNEVRKIVNDCLAQVQNLLEKSRKQLDALASVLLEKETLNADEVNAALGLPPAEPAQTET